jgi:hypothetical protein
LREILKTNILEEGSLVIKTLKKDFGSMKLSVDKLLKKNQNFVQKISGKMDLVESFVQEKISNL